MTKEKDLAECYTSDISGIVESFSEKDAAGKQSLQQLLNSDPTAFCIAGIRILARTKACAGSRYLAYLLAESKHSIVALLDPDSCALAEAVAVAKAAAETGKKLETALEMALGKALRGQNTAPNSARILRILELLAAVSAQSCWNSFQVELMAYPDKVVRSKAALLIGRQLKNSAWIGRRLMDRDLRVQANAVEALWELDGKESKPLLLVAAKSKNNRVAANAVLGLYRLGEKKAVGALLAMARHAEPLFRISGLWAIAETQDPRFLPFLAERFKSAQGKERLAIAGALARIRQRERTAASAGNLRVHCSEAVLEEGGRRRLVCSVSKPGTTDLAAIRPSELAIWENEVLIEDPELSSRENSAVVITGFIAPRFALSSDPSERAIVEALKQCLVYKRATDMWRIDRYAPKGTPSQGGSSATSAFPYGDSLGTDDLKRRHGCLTDVQHIQEALASVAPADRAAAGVAAAIERQCEALGKHGGKRHMVVMLDMGAAQALRDETVLAQLKELAGHESVALHGVSVDLTDEWPGFRALCQATADGSFHNITIDRLPETLDGIYAQQLNRLDISYSLPARDPGPVMLKICSSFGVGQAELTLNSSQG